MKIFSGDPIINPFNEWLRNNGMYVAITVAAILIVIVLVLLLLNKKSSKK